jgi:hypothetical protein
LKGSGRSGFVRPPLPPTYHPQPSSATTNKKSPVVSPRSQKSTVSTPTPAPPPQYSSLSPLTPETGFHDLLRKIEDEETAENEDDDDDDDDDELEDEDQQNEGEEYINEDSGYEDDVSLSQSSHANSSNIHSRDNSNSNSERKQPNRRVGGGAFFKQTSNSTASTLTSNTTLPLPNHHEQSTLLQDYGPLKNINHLRVLQLSHDDPEVLVGWKIFVPSYGNGRIISTKKKKFHTTRYMIQFENYSKLIELPLQRSKSKGTIAFTLIGKMK